MTISIESALANRALANSAVAAAVSTRVYVTRAPEAPTLPFIVLYRIVSTRHHTMQGNSGLLKVRVQASIFAKTIKEASEAATALRLCFDAFKGVQNSITFSAVLIETEFEAYEPQVEIRSIIQQYGVWADEAVS